MADVDKPLWLAIWVSVPTGVLLFVAYWLQVTGILPDALTVTLIPFGIVLVGVWLYSILRIRGTV